MHHLAELFVLIRKNVYFQIHFGAVYNSKGEYGWSEKFDEIQRTIESGI